MFKIRIIDEGGLNWISWLGYVCRSMRFDLSITSHSLQTAQIREAGEVLSNVRLPRVLHVQFLKIVKIENPPDNAGRIFYFGGVGGNRPSWPAISLASDMSLTGSLHAARSPCSPRVQKHSTDSSTYLVLPFDLILMTHTHTLRQDELPII